MKYSMFIGDGTSRQYKWLVNERLKLSKNVLICIRDMGPDETTHGIIK